MSHHLTDKHKIFKSHLVLGVVLVASALVLVRWPSILVALGAVAGIHVGVAIAVHVALALAGGGILATAVRSHVRTRSGGYGSPGATHHSPRFYDWLAAAHTR